MSKLLRTYVVNAGVVTVLPSGLNTTVLAEVPGTLSVGNAAEEFEVRPPGRMRLDKVLLTVKTAPGTQAIIVQVQVDGTDIFAAADRPQIAAGATSGESGPPLTTARLLTEDSVITVDIDQVGAAMNEGADLAVHLLGQTDDKD